MSASLEVGDRLDSPRNLSGRALRALLKAHAEAAVRQAAESEGLIRRSMVGADEAGVIIRLAPHGCVV